MEKSKWPQRLSRQGYTLDSTQWNKFRLSNIESLMGDEDRIEESVRYTGSKSLTRANEGEGPQPRRLGKRTRRGES